MNREARRQDRSVKRRRPAGTPRRAPVRVAGRRWPWKLWLGGLATLAVLGGVIAFATVEASGGSGPTQKDKAEALVKQDTPGLPGTFYASQGNDHLAPGTVYPICSDTVTDKCYQSNPPTSGPHDPTAAPWGFQTKAFPKEQLVHAMEHSGVVIWYNTTDPSVLDAIKKAMSDEAAKGHKMVVASPYSGMAADTVALTSWTRLDTIQASDFTTDPSGTLDRVKTFIDKLEHRYNPESEQEP